jgi:hypothetical protein
MAFKGKVKRAAQYFSSPEELYLSGLSWAILVRNSATRGIVPTRAVGRAAQQGINAEYRGLKSAAVKCRTGVRGFNG